MPMFWIAGALMLGAAMACVLLPLLRGTRTDAKRRDALLQAHRAGVIDADEYAAKLAALPPPPAAASAPRALIVAVAVLLPFLAVLGYRVVGDPRALDAGAQSATAAAMNAALAGQQPPSGDAPDMDAAVAGLAERLKQQPDDLDGWLLLGRAYKTMERFEPAREALGNAYRLAPDDPNVLIDYAEAQVLASQTRRFEGEPLALLQRALALQPDSQRGLWLLGASQFQRDDHAAAAATWERLLALLPPDASPRDALVARIDDARSRANLPPLDRAASTQAPPSSTPPSATATPAAARLTVTVDIAPALKQRVAAGDVLFVFARAAQGPRMPLAIQRLDATALPATVTLDDSTSMLPSMTLSSVPQVVVGARISKSGNAIAQSGDLETLSEPIPATRAEPVPLTIDRVVP